MSLLEATPNSSMEVLVQAKRFTRCQCRPETSGSTGALGTNRKYYYLYS